MFKIFKENRDLLTMKEIEKRYGGKWVFIVNIPGPFFTPNEDGEMEPAFPTAGEVLVVADKPYEGKETGIYDEIKSNRDKYGSCMETFLHKYPRFPQYRNIKEQECYRG